MPPLFVRQQDQQPENQQEQGRNEARDRRGLVYLGRVLYAFVAVSLVYGLGSGQGLITVVSLLSSVALLTYLIVIPIDGAIPNERNVLGNREEEGAAAALVVEHEGLDVARIEGCFSQYNENSKMRRLNELRNLHSFLFGHERNKGRIGHVRFGEFNVERLDDKELCKRCIRALNEFDFSSKIRGAATQEEFNELISFVIGGVFPYSYDKLDEAFCAAWRNACVNFMQAVEEDGNADKKEWLGRFLKEVVAGFNRDIEGKEFVCPISHGVMMNPVRVLSQGQERANLFEHDMFFQYVERGISSGREVVNPLNIQPIESIDVPEDEQERRLRFLIGVAINAGKIVEGIKDQDLASSIFAENVLALKGSIDDKVGKFVEEVMVSFSRDPNPAVDGASADSVSVGGRRRKTGEGAGRDER